MCIRDSLRVVPGAQAVEVHQPQQGQQAGGAALVVDEAGFEEAALRHLGLGIDAHEVAGADAQRLHLLPGQLT